MLTHGDTGVVWRERIFGHLPAMLEVRSLGLRVIERERAMAQADGFSPAVSTKGRSRSMMPSPNTVASIQL